MGRTEHTTTAGDGTFYGYWALGQYLRAATETGQKVGPDFMTVIGEEFQGQYHLQLTNRKGLAGLFAHLACDRPEDLANLDADPPTEMQKIILAQLRYSRSSLSNAAGKNLDLAGFTEKSNMHATALHYLRRSTELGLEAQEKDQDDVNKLLQGIVKQGIDLIPVVKTAKASDVGGFIAGPIIDGSLNKLIPTDNVAEYQRTLPKNSDAFDVYHMDIVQDALRQKGDWEKGKSPQEWIADPENDFGPENSFVDEKGYILDRNTMTDAQRKAYNIWWHGAAEAFPETLEAQPPAQGKPEPNDAEGIEEDYNGIRNGANSAWTTGDTMAEKDAK
jgi:hypothetical protein